MSAMQPASSSSSSISSLYAPTSDYQSASTADPSDSLSSAPLKKWQPCTYLIVRVCACCVLVCMGTCIIDFLA